MANEVQVRNSLILRSGNIDYSSKPTTFNGDMSGAKGPTPGAIEVSVAGIDVDLSELTVPGYCVLHNLDDTNYVDVGIWDPDYSLFYPLLELRAGEIYVLRLSRNLASEYGTGAGTAGASNNTLRLKANAAACDVVVEAFEA